MLGVRVGSGVWVAVGLAVIVSVGAGVAVPVGIVEAVNVGDTSGAALISVAVTAASPCALHPRFSISTIRTIRPDRTAQPDL